MKNIIVTVAIFTVLACIGCLNDSNTKIQNPETSPTAAAPLIFDTTANKIQTSPSNTISTPAASPSPVVSTAPTKGGLNPAHGQPGHRCDISVGAPLDSKPVQTNIQTTAGTTAAVPVVPTALSTSPATGNGLNPAHGQPGHRCEIAVGAPLDSKPAQTNIQSQPSAATPAATTVVPASLPVLNTPPSTGKGLNPAHGQPGHRCEIAVGAPLNSKPVK